MTEAPSTDGAVVHRHYTVATTAAPSNPKKDSFSVESDSSIEDLAFYDTSARARFSLDSLDPLSNTHSPHPSPTALKRSLLRRIVHIFALILLWYTFSLLLSLYNKWMFAPGHLNFPFPLFVTSLHMVVQFFLSGFVLWKFPRLRPQKEDLLTPKEYWY